MTCKLAWVRMTRAAAAAAAVALASCSAEGLDSGGETGDPTFFPSGSTGGQTSQGPATATDPSPTEPPYETETETGEVGPDAAYCPCDFIDCGSVPSKWCIGPMEDPNFVEAFCACPDSTTRIGHRCLTCRAVGSSHDINIDVQSVGVSVLVDGSQLPNTDDDDAALVLGDLDAGDLIPVGSSAQGMISARVISKLYDLYYQLDDNASGALPENSNGRIARVPIDLTASGLTLDDLRVETVSAEVSGTISLSDGEVPVSEADSGRLYLRHVASGDEVALGSTTALSVSARVLAGTYDLYYELVSAGGLMPNNGRARVLNSIVVGADGDPNVKLDVALNVTTVTGDFTINGATPPLTEDDYGLVYLRDESTGDLILLGPTTSSSYAVRLLPGVYAPIYTHVNAANAKVPVNKHARVGPALVLDAAQGATEFNIEIPMVTMTGQFTIGLQPPPSDPTDDGALTLEGEGGTALLGSTRDQQYAAQVIPGEYDVFYAQQTAGAVVPANTHARVHEAVTIAGGTLDIDVPVVTLTGALGLSGAGGQASEFEDGRVYLKDADAGDSVLLGSLSAGAYARRVVPGTYDVHYSIETGGAVVPVNGNARFGDPVTIEDGLPLDVDVPVTEFSLSVTFNEGSPPSSEDDTASLYLVNLESGDELFLGDTHALPATARVVVGDYIIRYRNRGPLGPGVAPQNRNAALECVTLGQ